MFSVGMSQTPTSFAAMVDGKTAVWPKAVTEVVFAYLFPISTGVRVFLVNLATLTQSRRSEKLLWERIAYTSLFTGFSFMHVKHGTGRWYLDYGTQIYLGCLLAGMQILSQSSE